MVGDSCDFEYAWALVESQDFPKVWEYVVPYANAGDADAQCMMGFLCQFSPARDYGSGEMASQSGGTKQPGCMEYPRYAAA